LQQKQVGIFLLQQFPGSRKFFFAIKEIKEKLLKEQEEIELNEDKDTELESRHYRTDLDCRAAGVNLWFLHVSVKKRLVLNLYIVATFYCDFCDTFRHAVMCMFSNETLKEFRSLHPLQSSGCLSLLQLMGCDTL